VLADDITDVTFEKIVLMLVATPGMMAPAATATKPAIRAYSMRSCPRVSFQILSFQIRFFITAFLSLLVHGRSYRTHKSLIGKLGSRERDFLGRLRGDYNEAGN
jgi:hypothetical protein